MSFAYLVSLLLLGSIAFALVREMRKASPRPAGLRGHIRARGWGLAAAAGRGDGRRHDRPRARAGRGRTRHRGGPGDLGPAAGRQARPVRPARPGPLRAHPGQGLPRRVQQPGPVRARAGRGRSLPARVRPAAGRSVLRPRHVAAPAGGGAGRRAGPGADRPVARPPPRRDLAPAGPAPDPGHRDGPVPAGAGAYWFGMPWITVSRGLRSRRGHRRGQPGPGVPLAGLGRDRGRGGPARARCLRAADRGVLAVGARIRLRLRPLASPRAGPSAWPCRAPRCSRWGCGWRRG